MPIHRYVVSHFVDYSLDAVIRTGYVFVEEHVRLIIYSLMRGLKV